MAAQLIIFKGLSIPLSELQFRFTRSGGPGGQNVNKVETQVELLFSVTGSVNLNDEQKDILRNKLRSRIDKNGTLHIIGQTSRYQWRNRQEAVEKFIALLQKLLTPKKKRVATKASAASKQKRLESKKKRGQIKKMRRVREE